MSKVYTSFLICEHEQAIQIYLEGLPIATYYKGTQKLEVSPNVKREDLQRVEDTVTSVLLLLKTRQNEFVKP